MEIKVSVEDAGKLVRLEVNESHTVREVVEQLIEGLNLPTNRIYSLMSDDLMYGPDKYSLTIQDLGIKDGGQLKLKSETAKPTPTILDEKVYGYIVDHGGVVSISKMSDELEIPIQELDKSLKRLTATGRLEKTEDKVSLPEVRKIETFRPEPELRKRPPRVEEKRIERRRYLGYTVLTAATVAALASAYTIYQYTKPPPTIPTPTPTLQPTTTPTPTQTPTPTPIFEGTESIFSGTIDVGDLGNWIHPVGVNASRLKKAAGQGISLSVRIYGSLQASNMIFFGILPYDPNYRFYLEGKWTFGESCFQASEKGFPWWQDVRNVNFDVDLSHLRDQYKKAFGIDPVDMDWYLAIYNVSAVTYNPVNINAYREYHRV